MEEELRNLGETICRNITHYYNMEISGISEIILNKKLEKIARLIEEYKQLRKEIEVGNG